MERIGLKKIFIKYDVSSLKQFIKGMDKILLIFPNKNTLHLEINIILNDISENDIKKIVNHIYENKTIKEITNNTIFTFIFTINPYKNLAQIINKIKKYLARVELNITNDSEVLRKTLRSLKNKKIPSCLLIKEKDLKIILKLYEENKIYGYPIFVENEIEYGDYFITQLKKWSYDTKGCRINIFADLYSEFILDYWGCKCEHKSCVTKIFSIDIKGNIYSCKKKENIICNLHEISSIIEIFSHDKFVNLLNLSIKKRGECKENCQYYNICKGGCPLKLNFSNGNCQETQLFKYWIDIKYLICSTINISDYRILNPAVREIILSGISSNKIFEKDLIESIQKI